MRYLLVIAATLALAACVRMVPDMRPETPAALPPGTVSSAAWSYELEVPPSYMLCDLVIGFQDDAGPGAIIIEAKRTTEKLAKGIAAKDDPRERAYLTLPVFSEVKRKAQFLLVSGDAAQNLSSGLRASPNLITWEELGAVQMGLLSMLSANRESFCRALQLHHSFLGIGKPHGTVPDVGGAGRLTPARTQAFEWGVERYARYLKLKELSEAEGWLNDEPGRSGLLAREGQTGKDRQYPWWREIIR